jgi:hypothetical protein
MKTFLSLAIIAAIFGFFACNALAETISSPSLFAASN